MRWVSVVAFLRVHLGHRRMATVISHPALPREVQQFCRVSYSPVELFADECRAASFSRGVSAAHSGRVSVTQHHTGAVREGSRLASERVHGTTERLLDDLSIDGLQWLCRELRIAGAECF